MKQASITLCLLICLCMAHSAEAQSLLNKPLQFKQYPAVITCTAAQLSSLFTQKIGDKPVINLNTSLQLKGVITNKISKFNAALETVVIELPAFSHSIFSISRRKENNADVFIGHLYNSNFADGYQLKKGKNADYEMIKIAAGQILQPCNY